MNCKVRDFGLIPLWPLNSWVAGGVLVQSVANIEPQRLVVMVKPNPNPNQHEGRPTAPAHINPLGETSLRISQELQN
jgi:hypothetical protein